MTPEEAVAALDVLDVTDPEAAHMEADAILLRIAPDEVWQAYRRLVERAPWWAMA